jgi:hypothetical protein
MHQQGNFEVKLNCKLFLATNYVIKFDQDDGGIDRRVYYRYKYKFVQSPNNRNPFEREIKTLPEFDDNYKNTMFVYFAQWCKLFYQGYRVFKVIDTEKVTCVSVGYTRLVNVEKFAANCFVISDDAYVSYDDFMIYFNYAFPDININED